MKTSGFPRLYVRTTLAALKNLRWRAVEALAPRRTVESRGLRFSLQCDNRITSYRYRTYNAKEPNTLEWIDTCVRDGDVVFDIGANIGVYTIYMALRHPRARIVAFEPEYANLHLLRDNIIKNGLQGRVAVYSVALGSHNGLSFLHVQDLTPGSALHTESRDCVEMTLTGHRVVWREGICTYRLDEFCRQTNIWPQCLKIDVDGTESQVLEGAQETLGRSSFRSVLFELPADSTAQATCKAILSRAGLRQEQRGLSNSLNQVWIREP